MADVGVVVPEGDKAEVEGGGGTEARATGSDPPAVGAIVGVPGGVPP